MNPPKPSVILTADETEFLARYRTLSEEDKRYVMRLAMLARNGVDIGKDQAKKGIKS